jgi:hypothetical protein
VKRFFKSPHLLTTLWAGAWTLFFVSESLKWHQVLPATRLWIVLGAVFVLLAIVPCRWEAPGGALLIICGVGLLLAYDIWPPRQLGMNLVVLLDLLLALPPLIAGVLFLGRRI